MATRRKSAFAWFASWAGPNVKTLLGNYADRLLSHDYSAYARYVAQAKDIVRAQCWAHARKHSCEAEVITPWQYYAVNFLGEP